VCLHGFTDTWRTWELVLPALERRHEVLAPTLAGHAGGPRIEGDVTDDVLADAVEAAMDGAGLADAHLVGNSLGGHVALQLAARGRARSVVALAPAGGWAGDDATPAALLDRQAALHAAARRSAPHADAIVATADGRRRATLEICERYEHLPAELLAHQLRGIASCTAAPAMIDHARTRGWAIDLAAVRCPVRIVWGTADRLLPWPSAAQRFQRELPQADWVLLDGVGHAPQLDVPVETAQLILGFTDP
jgi:pimeloyl-ACP methyl ester carboxylesterase